MAQVKGTILTERDRALLAYVGIARYVSAEHVHRLIIGSPNRKLAYRRLTKLCTAGSRPGDAAYLRRLEFRRRKERRFRSGHSRRPGAPSRRRASRTCGRRRRRTSAISSSSTRSS